MDLIGNDLNTSQFNFINTYHAEMSCSIAVGNAGIFAESRYENHFSGCKNKRFMEEF